MDNAQTEAQPVADGLVDNGPDIVSEVRAEAEEQYTEPAAQNEQVDFSAPEVEVQQEIIPENEWEVEARKFQSMYDRTQAENDKLKRLEPLGDLLESRPDLVDVLQKNINGQPQQQQAQQATPEQAAPLHQQAADILAQFSAPICAQLVAEFMATLNPDADEDPLVRIRKQELALRGQELQQRGQEFQQREEREWAEMEKDIDIDEDRLNLQEKIALIRDETAQDRLKQTERFHEDDMRKQ